MKEIEKGIDDFNFLSLKSKLINPLNGKKVTSKKNKNIEVVVENDSGEIGKAIDFNECLESKNIRDSDIFKPVKVNRLLLKNRMCFLGFSDENFITDKGQIKKSIFDYYQKIAKTNVGMIFTGGFDLSYKNLLSMSSWLQEKKVVDKFKNFTREVHSFGCKIFMKVKSIFGRADYNNKLMDSLPFSTGFYKNYFNTNLNCIRLSDKLINNIIDEMANLAMFSSDCAFDGILLDGDLFGLNGEISSLEINKRSLGYFSETNDFVTKLLTKILNYNRDLNVFYSVSYKTFIEDVYGKESKKIKTAKSFVFNQSYKKFIDYLCLLVKLGVDGFVFNNGTFETEFLSSPTELMSDDIFKEFYIQINNYFKQKKIKNKFGSDITFIYKDKFETIDAELANSENILFDITKNILADNDIIYKESNSGNIKNCIRCGFCSNNFNKNNATRCIINPESELFIDGYNSNKIMEKSSAIHKDTKNIAIIGAGVSGVNCAIYLAKRGFIVHLFDKSDRLLKNNRLRELFGYNDLLKKYNDYLESEVYKLNNFSENNINNVKNGLNKENKDKLIVEGSLKDNLQATNKNGCINLFLKQTFSDEFLKDKSYDSIIIATGSKEKFLDIPGAVLKNVKSISDVLTNKNVLANKKNIVIISKTELSLSLAVYLLLDGKRVTLVIESMDYLLKMQNSRLTFFLYALSELNCKVFPFAKVNKIEQDFVEISINSKVQNEKFASVILNYKSGTNYKYEERVKNIDADFIIYEPETYSNNKLYYDLVQAGFSGNLFMIGDALYPCDLDESIKTAYFVAKNI